MPTVTQVNDLKINKLTKAQYDAAVQAGTIGENEISVITDLDATPQVDSLPTADAAQEGKIYQFIGTTTGSYTNGYFYKCVSDGQNPATYSWAQVNVQPAVDPLPSQTGNAGKFLTTDGTDASWSDKPLVNVATSSGSVIVLATQNLGNTDVVGIGRGVRTQGNYDVAIGANAVVNGDGIGGVSIGNQVVNYGRAAVAIGSNAQTLAYAVSGIAIGYKAKVNQFINYGIAIGNQSTIAANYAIQIGTGSGGAQVTNSDANTVKIANANGNFEMMSADGTIPEARLADTTSATEGQVLQLDSNSNAVWETPVVATFRVWGANE